MWYTRIFKTKYVEHRSIVAYLGFMGLMKKEHTVFGDFFGSLPA